MTRTDKALIAGLLILFVGFGYQRWSPDANRPQRLHGDLPFQNLFTDPTQKKQANATDTLDLDQIFGERGKKK